MARAHVRRLVLLEMAARAHVQRLVLETAARPHVRRQVLVTAHVRMVLETVAWPLEWLDFEMAAQLERMVSESTALRWRRTQKVSEKTARRLARLVPEAAARRQVAGMALEETWKTYAGMDLLTAAWDWALQARPFSKMAAWTPHARPVSVSERAAWTPHGQLVL